MAGKYWSIIAKKVTDENMLVATSYHLGYGGAVAFHSGKFVDPVVE